jgi:hypothetical protein
MLIDPVVAAGSFANIVGLLSNFKAERSGATLDAFIVWLKEKHREDTVAALERNDALADELSALLSINHDLLVQRLEELNSRFSELAANLEGFGGLAKVFQPSSVLSEQARSILVQMADSASEFAMENKFERTFMFLTPGSGVLAFPEPRYIEDDLDILLGNGLLRVEYASAGSRRLYITRSGAQLAATLKR